MSPEQARGEPSDHRSDIFSFGAVLYEMLSGQRAFQGNSPVETLSAILKEQPPDLTLVVPGLSPGLARIVDRCLEKNRDDRFQSAADLRLRARGDLGRVDAGRASSAAPARCRGRRVAAVAARWPWRWAAAFALGAAPARAAAAALPAADVPSRRGAGRAVRRRRPDDHLRRGLGRPDRPSSSRPGPTRPRRGRCRWPAPASSRCRRRARWRSCSSREGFGRVEGTLARARAGRRRAAATGARACSRPTGRPTGRSWPSSSTQQRPGRARVPDRPHALRSQPGPHHAYPLLAGRRRHRRHLASGVGRHRGDRRARRLQGRRTTLSSGWNSVLGPGLGAGRQRGLVHRHAQRRGPGDSRGDPRAAQERLLLSAPATLTLHDVSPDGRALVSRDAWGAGVMALAPGQRAASATCRGSTARPPGTSRPTAPPRSSRKRGKAAAPPARIYLRTTDGAPAVRLGDGVPLALSPDKQWVLSTPVAADRLVLLPTGVGQARPLPTGPIASYFPGGAVAARRPPLPGLGGRAKDRPTRVYLQSIDGGDPPPVTPEGAFGRIAVLPGGDTLRHPRRRPPAGGVRGGRRRAAAGRRRRARRPPDCRQRRRRVALRAGRRPPSGSRSRASTCGADAASRCGRCFRPTRPAPWNPAHRHDPRRPRLRLHVRARAVVALPRRRASLSGPFGRCHPVTNASERLCSNDSPTSIFQRVLMRFAHGLASGLVMGVLTAAVGCERGEAQQPQPAGPPPPCRSPPPPRSARTSRSRWGSSGPSRPSRR